MMKVWIVVVACLALTFSCSKTPEGPGTPPDMGSDVDMEPDLPQICEPGEVISCRTLNTPSIDVCSADGTSIEIGSCGSEPPQICRDDQCVEVACVPGSRRCRTDRQPQQCSDDGTGFSDIEECPQDFRCDDGVCLNRCQIAELTGSYIGCEYWAVELENHLLDDEKVLGDNRPPFAVVIANTSTTYDVTISVFSDTDEVAEAISTREVHSDIQLPGIDFVTVRSEVVDQNGVRLFTVNGPINEIPLPRQAVMTLLLPHREVPFGESSLTQTAYRVVSSDPVVAYQFNPLCCNYNYTNDASLLLPTSALTGNYMFMSYAVWAGTTNARLPNPYSATMTVVGTKPDTEVTIRMRPSRDVNRPYSDIIYPPSSARISGPDAQGIIRTTLQPFDVLNIAAGGASPVEDLTGALISASEPVAVFGGHTCAFVPFSNPACDHLESQIFPLETWGRRFVAAPLKLRRDPDDPTPTQTREGTYWKFLAYADGTVINTGLNMTPPNVLPPAAEGVRPCWNFSEDPTSGQFTLNSGETCEFGTTRTFVAESTRPILLGAFLSGQNSVKPDARFGDHAGDPAFFLVPPEEQFRTNYSFLTPATYFVSYVTVLTRPGFTVTLDGQTINPLDYDHEILEDYDVLRAHIPVDDGPHTIESAIPFGIVVYGYDDYVSYAYTGGLDLAKLNEDIPIIP